MKLGLGGPEAANFKRYGVPERAYEWGKLDARFNIDKEQNEPNRFGWIVEIDPFDKGEELGRQTRRGMRRQDALDPFVVIGISEDLHPRLDAAVLDQAVNTRHVIGREGQRAWSHAYHSDGPVGTTGV